MFDIHKWKKCFTTGLAILLPSLLTLMIVIFFINLVTTPFLEPVKALISQLDLFQHKLHLGESSALITGVSKVLVLLLLFGFILFVGSIGKFIFIDYLIQWGDSVFHKVPYINKIYKVFQDVIRNIFSSSSKSFSQVVFVPFPNNKNFSIGLVTCESVVIQNFKHKEEWVSVFVPETPNPSAGFLLFVKKKQLVFSNMKVEEAMKFVVSCGITIPEFTTSQSQAAYETTPSD